MSVTPEGLLEEEDYTFESGLAPEWLWQDLGYGDGSWVPGFLEEQSGDRYSPPDQNNWTEKRVSNMADQTLIAWTDHTFNPGTPQDKGGGNG
jgi:hypothetical protein